MYAKCFKRVIDFTLSLCALIVLSPLLLVLIILGAIFMQGNPFFTQERPGKDEKVFKLIKFRSMDNRKDSNGNLLPDSIRLNKYGRILRATSLDELPELINILNGDMSIVGTRPPLISETNLYELHHRARLAIKPGITGMWQVSGRSEITDFEEVVKLDTKYISEWSFMLDIKILFKTVLIVLGQKGSM